MIIFSILYTLANFQQRMLITADLFHESICLAKQTHQCQQSQEMVKNGDEKGFTCFHVSLCPSRSSVSLPAFKGQSKCGKSCAWQLTVQRVSKDYTYTYLAIIKRKTVRRTKGEGRHPAFQPGIQEKLHRGGVLEVDLECA